MCSTTLPCVAVASVVLLFAGCSPSGTEQTAVQRGDVAFARDSLEEALAEYRLAVRQGDDAPGTLARVAHTYVRMGRIDEARDFYRRAAEEDPSLSDQAASDFVGLARDASQRDDRFQMASAMSAALQFRPGLGVQELALPLARHYFDAGAYGSALPFYQKALSATTDSAPDLVYEIGQAHEQLDDCERALVFFERYRSMIEPWERDEVDWYIGNCALGLAREKRLAARELEPTRRPVRLPPDSSDPSDLRRALRRPADRFRVRGGRVTRDTLAPGAEPGVPADTASPPPESREGLLEEALRLVSRTIELGEPRNLLGRAWFERGEILSLLGHCEAALEAFDEVPYEEPSENTALARRARDRYDEILFGRGLRDLTSTGSCG